MGYILCVICVALPQCNNDIPVAAAIFYCPNECLELGCCNNLEGRIVILYALAFCLIPFGFLILFLCHRLSRSNKILLLWKDLLLLNHSYACEYENWDIMGQIANFTAQPKNQYCWY